jgi:hypothetical protein
LAHFTPIVEAASHGKERSRNRMDIFSRTHPQLIGYLSEFRDNALKRGVPAAEVERWIDVAARPCAELSLGGDGPVVGHFGGPLLLPPDLPDPRYPFLASLDCAALPAGATDLPLPGDGRLLLFAHADDPYGSGGGGRAIYIPADASVEEREVEYKATHFNDAQSDANARKIVEQYPQGDMHLAFNFSLPPYGSPDIPDYFCNTLFREHPYAQELSAEWHAIQWRSPGGMLRLGGYAWDDGHGGADFTQEQSTGKEGNEWVLLADWYTHITSVILSFRVSRGCDLRRPVVDSVADGTLAA